MLCLKKSCSLAVEKSFGNISSVERNYFYVVVVELIRESCQTQKYFTNLPYWVIDLDTAALFYINEQPLLSSAIYSKNKFTYRLPLLKYACKGDGTFFGEIIKSSCVSTNTFECPNSGPSTVLEICCQKHIDFGD